MRYYKQTPEGHVPFTAEEEAEQDARIAALANSVTEPSAPAPTKEQLLAQLQALQAQIQALE